MLQMLPRATPLIHCMLTSCLSVLLPPLHFLLISSPSIIPGSRLCDLSSLYNITPPSSPLLLPPPPPFRGLPLKFIPVSLDSGATVISMARTSPEGRQRHVRTSLLNGWYQDQILDCSAPSRAEGRGGTILHVPWLCPLGTPLRY